MSHELRRRFGVRPLAACRGARATPAVSPARTPRTAAAPDQIAPVSLEGKSGFRDASRADRVGSEARRSRGDVGYQYSQQPPPETAASDLPPVALAATKTYRRSSNKDLHQADKGSPKSGNLLVT